MLDGESHGDGAVADAIDSHTACGVGTISVKGLSFPYEAITGALGCSHVLVVLDGEVERVDGVATFGEGMVDRMGSSVVVGDVDVAIHPGEGTALYLIVGDAGGLFQREVEVSKTVAAVDASLGIEAIVVAADFIGSSVPVVNIAGFCIDIAGDVTSDGDINGDDAVTSSHSHHGGVECCVVGERTDESLRIAAVEIVYSVAVQSATSINILGIMGSVEDGKVEEYSTVATVAAYKAIGTC